MKGDKTLKGDKIKVYIVYSKKNKIVVNRYEYFKSVKRDIEKNPDLDWLNISHKNSLQKYKYLLENSKLSLSEISDLQKIILFYLEDRIELLGESDWLYKKICNMNNLITSC